MEKSFPPITYNYPNGCNYNPFDINAEGKFFVDARGFTYLSESLEPFSFKKPYYTGEIDKVIPMGYKTIIVNERLAFIKDGQIIKDDKEEHESTIERYFYSPEMESYKIYSNKKVFYEKYNEYLYQLSVNGGWGLGDTIWKSKQEAVNHAIYVSKNDKSIDLLLICKGIAAISWH